METESVVLIVDDEPAGRKTLESALLGHGYQLAQAASGAETLAQAAALTPDLILLDVMMPDMDGLETLRRLRGDPQLAEIPVILVTSLDDRDSRLAGLDAGADDFVSKPFDRTEIRVRVRTITRLNRYRKVQEATRLRKALATAAQVQAHLLPRQLPAVPGLDVACRCRYCEAVGGDTYDLFPLADGAVGITQGDVTGHGVPAALVMASTQTLIHCLSAAHGLDPARMVAEVNRYLLANTPFDYFVTLFYAVYQPASRTLRYASAGHEPGMWYSAADGRITSLESTGPLLGLLPEVGFRTAPPVQLAPGDIVVLPTDGVVELHGPEQELFGRDRLEEVVRANADRPAAEIVDAVLAACDAYRGLAPASDDITLVVLKQE
ncbi:MAG: SpoIIE family protein phosphatase [Gemmataceae bacterium]